MPVDEHDAPWPDRIIDLPPGEKIRLALLDPGRYMTQCREERLIEARMWVAKYLAEKEAARRHCTAVVLATAPAGAHSTGQVVTAGGKPRCRGGDPP